MMEVKAEVEPENPVQPQRLLVEQPIPEVVVVGQEVLVMAEMAGQE